MVEYTIGCNMVNDLKSIALAIKENMLLIMRWQKHTTRIADILGFGWMKIAQSNHQIPIDILCGTETSLELVICN